MRRKPRGRMPEKILQAVDRGPETGRRNGELKALVKDLELKLAESFDRERLLGEKLDATDGEAVSRERELHQKLRTCMEFHEKVDRSRSWRILQFLRGLFGRRW